MTPEQGSASRALFTVTPDPVAVLELLPNGTIVVETANAAFARSVGWDLEELPGTPLPDIYAPNALDDLREQLGEVAQRQAQIGFDAICELPTGRHVHRSILTPLPLGRVLVVEHDLSAERASEQRLHDLEHLTETGTWSWNLRDDHLTLSGEFRRVAGLSATHPTSLQEAVSLIHPEDRARVRHALGEAAVGEATDEVLGRLVRADGQERHVSIRATLVTDRDGVPVRLSGTMQDITARREVEAAEATRQRMVRQQARALQLNDDVLQSLACAWLAIDLERMDEARQALTDSMDRVRHIMAELLQATGELHGPGTSLRPGDLAGLRAERDDESWPR